MHRIQEIVLTGYTLYNKALVSPATITGCPSKGFFEMALAYSVQLMNPTDSFDSKASSSYKIIAEVEYDEHTSNNMIATDQQKGIHVLILNSPAR